MEFHLFLPQMRMSFEQLVTRILDLALEPATA